MASYFCSEYKKKRYFRQTKQIFNFYKNNIKDVIDNNINNKLSSKNNFL